MVSEINPLTSVFINNHATRFGSNVDWFSSPMVISDELECVGRDVVQNRSGDDKEMDVKRRKRNFMDSKVFLRYSADSSFFFPFSRNRVTPPSIDPGGTLHEISNSAVEISVPSRMVLILFLYVDLFTFNLDKPLPRVRSILFQSSTDRMERRRKKQLAKTKPRPPPLKPPNLPSCEATGLCCMLSSLDSDSIGYKGTFLCCFPSRSFPASGHVLGQEFRPYHFWPSLVGQGNAWATFPHWASFCLDLAHFQSSAMKILLGYVWACVWITFGLG